jgi:hypothetical protein
MNMAEPILPRLSASATQDEASLWLGDVVFTLGHGFHPDTPPSDYVCLDTGQSSLDAHTAEDLSEDLDTAFGILGDRVYDDACWYAWRLQYGLPCEPVHNFRTRLLLALQIIDSNGEYSDRDAFRNGWAPMTLSDAKDTLIRLLSA